VKLKLDENLSRRAADLIRTAGHDVATSASQGLRGAADEILFDVCKQESRALVTLDRDFGEVLRYPPAGSAVLWYWRSGIGPHMRRSSRGCGNSSRHWKQDRRRAHCGSSSPGGYGSTSNQIEAAPELGAVLAGGLRLCVLLAGLKHPGLLAVIDALAAELTNVREAALAPILAGSEVALRDAVPSRNGSTRDAPRDANVLALAWSVEADVWTTDRDFAGAGIAS
jgi:predicted nuclease of predicted toxin-antitoxin system